MARTEIPLNTAVGDRGLCAWQPVRGVVWVQTRHPRHALRLARRKDGRLIVRGVAGGYLRTFAFRHSITWALRLMTRYRTGETDANAVSNGANGPRTNQNKRGHGGHC